MTALLTAAFCAASGSMDLVRKELSLGFPDLTSRHTPLLDYDVSHQEILRESRNDSLLSRYTLRSQALSFRYPLKGGTLHGSGKRSVYGIADAFQNRYVFTDPQPVSHGFTLALDHRLAGWECKPQIGYARVSESDTLRVNTYPRSETAAYNNYFFDLLPATFGDTLPWRLALHRATAALQMHREFNARHLYFSLHYTRDLIRMTESHENTGPHEKIRGPRESRLAADPFSLQFMSAWQFDEKHLLRLSYRFGRFPLGWKHTVFPDEPDTLERVELASGISALHSLQFGYRFQSGHTGSGINAAGALLHGRLSASTPVLGYVFRILPISHQCEGDGRLRYVLTHLYAKHTLKTGFFGFTPRVDLLAARIYSDYTLDAHLQFGLEDLLTEKTYIHALYMIAPGFRSEFALNPDLRLSLRAEQIIPFAKTVYPELPPPPPPEVRRYGGLSVSAGVSLTW